MECLSFEPHSSSNEGQFRKNIHRDARDPVYRSMPRKSNAVGIWRVALQYRARVHPALLLWELACADLISPAMPSLNVHPTAGLCRETGTSSNNRKTVFRQNRNGRLLPPRADGYTAQPHFLAEKAGVKSSPRPCATGRCAHPHRPAAKSKIFHLTSLTCRYILIVVGLRVWLAR